MIDYNVNGELCFRGPTVFMGYLNNAEANKAFDREGFYHTGDIGYRVRGGKNLWYIVDRRKELLKVRGFQVAPPELEAVLLGHPEIVDAAVIGVQYKASDSQMPRAYIVKRPTPEGDRLSEQDIRNFMKDKLAKYKELTGGVQFVSEIPKNASGKILKRLLRERAKKEMGVRL